MNMRKEVLDFRLAVSAICEAAMKPEPGCWYGYAKRPTELMLLYEHHNEAIQERAKYLDLPEIAGSISFVRMFYNEGPELDRVIQRIRKLVEKSNIFTHKL